MANHFSALKRQRSAERRTIVNRRNMSQLRHGIRKMRRLLAAKDVAGAKDALSTLFSLIDRSASKGVIKKNTASRYKSRLHMRVVALSN